MGDDETYVITITLDEKSKAVLIKSLNQNQERKNEEEVSSVIADNVDVAATSSWVSMQRGGGGKKDRKEACLAAFSSAASQSCELVSSSFSS